MKPKRCFIALDLPREVINEIKRVQKLIGKKFIFKGKYTELENLHLTLKFLGEIDDARIREVRERLKRVEVSRFDVKLGKVGVFSKKVLRIIWVELLGVSGLQEEVDKALDGLFGKEERFMSHITIARVKYIKENEELIEYLKCMKVKGGFKVDRFFLKESELMDDGPRYRVIESYRLSDRENIT